MPSRPGSAPFDLRLRDLLSTLESAALLGAAEARVRGLGEHLRFACLALPCSEALVALEMEALGRLSIPVVADAAGVRPGGLEIQPSGTPFAYLLAGGGGYAAELSPDDPMIAALKPALARPPAHGIFVPLRLGEAVIGGAALLSHEAPLGDRELSMAERLSEVLSLTVESFRTERVVFELFARALPDLLGQSAATSLPSALVEHIRAIRLLPSYRRRLELAIAVGRVADHGSAEATLAASLLARIDAYVRGIQGQTAGGQEA
jgi:GAF domain-containing protein